MVGKVELASASTWVSGWRPAVHEYNVFGVMPNVTSAYGIIDENVDSVACAVARIVCETVAKVCCGLVRPVSLIIEAGMNFEVGTIGAFSSAIAWCAPICGKGVTKGDHFFSLRGVGRLGCYEDVR